MREIKFRAKQCDNKWVYGSLVNNSKMEKLTIINWRGGRSYVTDPITIGQFTGLTDSKGVEIYDKSVINDEFYVDYIPCRYILRRLDDNTIAYNLDEYNNENTIIITKEYSGL